MSKVFKSSSVLVSNFRFGVIEAEWEDEMDMLSKMMEVYSLVIYKVKSFILFALNIVETSSCKVDLLAWALMTTSKLAVNFSIKYKSLITYISAFPRQEIP